MNSQIALWLSLTKQQILKGDSVKAGECARCLARLAMDTMRKVEYLQRTTLNGMQGYSTIRVNKEI